VLFPHPVAKETAEGETVRNEMRRMLDRGLGKLDAKYREPLVLFYFEDMNYEETAGILGIPTSTLGVRLRRGKAALKKLVEPFT
jgi:RNA polymerase sigma-70 factor (ECF subfamily)